MRTDLHKAEFPYSIKYAATNKMSSSSWKKGKRSILQQIEKHYLYNLIIYFIHICTLELNKLQDTYAR